MSNVKVGKYPLFIREGRPVIKVGCWYIERTKGGIYAYSVYQRGRNSSHHIPAEVVDGKPVYPFGTSHWLPAYVKKAMDFMVVSLGQKT